MPRKRTGVSELPETPRPPTTCVDRETLLAILRELKLDVMVRETSDWSSKGYVVEVTLRLDDDIIAQSSDTFDVATRDTSDSWRATHDF